jgi:hypothetical protein
MRVLILITAAKTYVFLLSSKKIRLWRREVLTSVCLEVYYFLHGHCQ